VLGTTGCGVRFIEQRLPQFELRFRSDRDGALAP
jgi:hypothetical protein